MWNWFKKLFTKKEEIPVVVESSSPKVFVADVGALENVAPTAQDQPKKRGRPKTTTKAATTKKPKVVKDKK